MFWNYEFSGIEIDDFSDKSLNKPFFIPEKCEYFPAKVFERSFRRDLR